MLKIFLVALIMWPLEALGMMVGLSWLNSYWPFVPTIPFFGAVALTFVISTIGTIFRGYANGTEKVMAKQGKHDKGKVDNIKDIHESDKSLDRASNKKEKPKGKAEKVLREWVEDIDSE